jgi:IS4 transposase
MRRDTDNIPALLTQCLTTLQEIHAFWIYHIHLRGNSWSSGFEMQMKRRESRLQADEEDQPLYQTRGRQRNHMHLEFAGLLLCFLLLNSFTHPHAYELLIPTRTTGPPEPQYLSIYIAALYHTHTIKYQMSNAAEICGI